MQNQLATAIYLCIAPENSSSKLDVDDLIEFIRSDLKPQLVWSPEDLKLDKVEDIVEIIRQSGIERIILAGEKPGFEKPCFARVMNLAGRDPKNICLVDFNEYKGVQMTEMEKAKAGIACAFFNVPLDEVLDSMEVDVHPDTLVIGGGIAGIQAALEIGNGQQKVYLVEKTGSIGGHMAMFDKTFPTLDCAACILTPKMVEVGQHPYIDLMTYSEVKEVTGSPGNYKVKILQKARRINLATCIGCGTCAEKCPSKVPSEFDQGTTFRKAAYIPFPQAVPNKYLIDADNCLYLKEGKCGVCMKVCPVPDCINMEEKDREVEVTVGNIIVATGFKVFDAKRAEQYGYGQYPNVLTSLEFERLINSAGPTEGKIVKRSKDKKGNWIFEKESSEPQSVALIHCIGSRDENYNKYCSKVCCMYSLKLAHLVKEKLPEADVYEYYIDMRAFGKGYEEFYNRIEAEGIHIVRGRTASIKEDSKGQLLLRSEDLENERLINQKVDMVVLAVGLEASEDAKEISKMVGVPIDENGWFNEIHSEGNPVDTIQAGISIAGLCQGPKDIPDTVAQASAAASRVMQSIMGGKIKVRLDISLNQLLVKINEIIGKEESWQPE
ncbi:MAG: FAD-dependent oxidoreductase [Marinifilaceae bacterium]